MIKVLLKFCKGGKYYKRGDLASFSEHDEKRLIDSGFAEIPKKYKKK